MVMSKEAEDNRRRLKTTFRDFKEIVDFFDDHPIETLELVNLESRLNVIMPMREVASLAFELCEEELTDETREDTGTKLREFGINYFKVIGQLQVQIKVLKAQESESKPGGMPPSAVKCPRLTLPSFDGSTEQWVTFHDLYTSIVHENSSLTDMARFQHLKTCLKVPSAENVLNGYPLKAENYQSAWKAVCDRYDDPRKIISHHLMAIVNVKKMANASALELRRIIDTFTSNITSLAQLGYPLASATDLANQIVIQLVTSQLDETILREWRKDTPSHATTWIELQAFLTQMWKSIDDTKFSSKAPQKEHNSKFPHQGKAHVSNNSNKEKSSEVSCSLCKESHWLWSCSKFRNFSVDERHKFVRSEKLCFNCLGKSHGAAQCRSKGRCKTCNQPHNSLLHFDKSMSAKSSKENAAQTSSGESSFSPEVKPFEPFNMMRKFNGHESQSSGNSMNATQAFTCRQQTMLSTISVYVVDAYGNVQLCRALLDSGSDANMMTTKCAKRLQLPFHDTFFPITGINEKTTIIRHKVITSIRSRYGEFEKVLELSLMENITGQLPSLTVNMTHLNIPKECFIADPDFHLSKDVDMLLSADVFYDSLLGEKIYLPNGPMLIHTKFGWIIGGSMKHQFTASSFLSCFTQGRNSGDNDIDAKLEKFFQADDSVYAKTTRTSEESYCEDLFVSTTTRDEQGKFIVQMPFKSNVNQLGTNLANAERALKWQESIRRKDENYNKLYVEYMENYIATRHMEEVPLSTDELAHYLPHHGVLKMSSTSTKLRPVFNASSKSETGISLNEVLCVGPTIQPESFDILLRFREKKFVFTGDIAKMYRQVWIHPSQRKYLRILWRSDLNAQVKHYQLNTVTFGTACAPFLATRSLQQLALENKKTFPKAAAVIENSFYVDDVVIGVDTIEEGVKLRDHIRYILAQSGMPLCKLSANCPDLLVGVPAKDIEPIEDDENQITKKLGIGYKPSSDSFCYHLKPMKEDSEVTKASVLSEIASIYDPIGWIGPVVLTAKLYMKKLWLLNMKWTDKVSDDFRAEWNNFREHFTAVNSIRISRHCFIDNHVAVELHGFCDASIAAYGAVIYAYSYDNVGNSQTSIICAKSRVAPKSQKTLARLELCGATLLSKLIDRTIGIFSTPITDVTLWSDSTIALNWIAISPSRLSTFVGNRVAVIQDLTHKYVWKHIRGVDNPADIISRGLQPTEMEHCSIWWNGPPFFKLPKQQWPESIISINEGNPEVTTEIKKVFVAQKPNDFLQFIETRFSRFTVLINTVAYMQRFITNCKRNRLINNDGPLTLDEKETAEATIIRTLQCQLFSAEYTILLKQRELSQMNVHNRHIGESIPQLSRASSLISLAPYMDEHGLIRVGGRIHACPELTINQKHPIIIPNCNFSVILIRELHKKHLHPGPLSTLAIVRENYYPINAKNIIRKVIHQCLICHRIKPIGNQQFMGDLPAARVTMTPPFTCTALDYAGFYNIRTSLSKASSSTKAYVAVFKCMCTGAIHLDLVSDLTSNAFIAVLDRFVSRRGLCAELFSDNATCFEGANNELQKIVKEMDRVVQQYCTDHAIKWNFTTPLAPHAGGIYESAVKSMKHHLKRVMSEQLYTFEQFTTILYKVEAILNSRPLTPMTENPNDLRVLTPGHFIIGRSMVAKPERNFIDLELSHLKRWDGLQKVQQSFWALWYHDFLHTLQTRPKNFREKFPFNIGDMVLLKDNNLPPMKWLMGRIIRLLPGKDKVVRRVKVITRHGEKDRDVRYLCLLPFETTPPTNPQP